MVIITKVWIKMKKKKWLQEPKHRLKQLIYGLKDLGLI